MRLLDTSAFASGSPSTCRRVELWTMHISRAVWNTKELLRLKSNFQTNSWQKQEISMKPTHTEIFHWRYLTRQRLCPVRQLRTRLSCCAVTAHVRHQLWRCESSLGVYNMVPKQLDKWGSWRQHQHRLSSLLLSCDWTFRQHGKATSRFGELCILISKYLCIACTVAYTQSWNL